MWNHLPPHDHVGLMQVVRYHAFHYQTYIKQKKLTQIDSMAIVMMDVYLSHDYMVKKSFF